MFSLVTVAMYVNWVLVNWLIGVGQINQLTH
jgi:hypothetical protein